MTNGKNKRKVRPMVKTLALLIGIAYMSLSPVTALDPEKAITQYHLDTWGEERDYRCGSIYDIWQTGGGYIWLATRDGLVRFDGIDFNLFDKGNIPQREDNKIKVLLGDRQGSLWIGTWSGGLSRLKEGKFKTWSTVEHPELNRIYAIFEDRDGYLWIGTMENGAVRIDTETGKMTAFTQDDGLPANKVRAFAEAGNSGLFIATDAGLARYDPGGKISLVMVDKKPFQKPIVSMYKAADGSLWLGCGSGEGLHHIKNNRIVSRYGMEEGLPNGLVKCMLEDRNGNLWAGTDGGGLVKITGGGFETYSSENGLKCDYVLSLYEDREGSLWLGTRDGGLHRLRDTPATSYAKKEGLSSDIVRCIAETDSGSILVGTDKGLNRLHNGHFSLELSKRDGLLSDHVYSLLEDRLGNLWIGTAKGLNLGKNGEISDFIHLGIGLDEFIKQLIEDEDGTIWILTKNKLLKYTEGTFNVMCDGKEVLAKIDFQCFFKQRDGTILIGTYGSGLCRLNDGKIDQITVKDGLAGNEVESIYKNRKGILFIGTRSGLSLDIDGEFKNCYTRDGLADNDVRNIMEDNEQRIWLATMSGVSVIGKTQFQDWIDGKIDRLTPVTYDESDGIKSPSFSKGIISSGSKLWCATENGAVVIDPAAAMKYVPPPPLVIKQMSVDGEPIAADRLFTQFSKKTPLVIIPGAKRLQIFYTALSFIKPRKVKYELKLEGYDNGWSNVGHMRTVTYPNLAPGNYTFRVNATNRSGFQGRQEASVSFYLKPHWYNTVWAYIAYALSFLAGLALFVRWRSWKLMREKERLQQLVDERTKEVHQQNLLLEEQKEKLKELDRVKSRFFANISHEFRTPLTLIKGPLEQLLTDYRDPKLEKNVNLALRYSQQLLSLINQLLDLSKLDSGKMQLQAARQNIVLFLKNTVTAFESLAEQRKLALLFQPEEDNIILFFDNEKLDKIICNLLVNAIRFTPAGGRITITVSVPDTPKERYPRGCLEITVSDTGTGIPADQLPYIFDRFFQADGPRSGQPGGTGIGLALVKELVALHYGEIFVSSRQGESCGTDFTLCLPLGSAHLKPGEITEKPTTSHYTGLKRPCSGAGEAPHPHDPGFTDNEKTTETLKDKDLILVVEDNRELRTYIRSALEPEFTIIEAENGTEGMDKALLSIPDLVVSDVMMPGMNGFQLCEALKKEIKTSHIPVILLTAKAGEESIIEGLETGADDYITKPFNVTILCTRIKNLITNRRTLQEKVQLQLMLDTEELPVSLLDRQFLAKVQNTIEKNLSNPEFGVDQLADALRMSRATLNRKLKALTGESPNRFIRSYRLNRAEQLLTSGRRNVTDVAFAVGFSSSAYFTRCFKEKFNRLPNTYNNNENGDNSA